MMRRLHLAALALLATIVLAFAQVGQIPAWPPIQPAAAGCSDTSLHTVTASGAASYTVPTGCGHVTLKAWGGGSAAGKVTFQFSAFLDIAPANDNRAMIALEA